MYMTNSHIQKSGGELLPSGSQENDETMWIKPHKILYKKGKENISEISKTHKLCPILDLLEFKQMHQMKQYGGGNYQLRKRNKELERISQCTKG